MNCIIGSEELDVGDRDARKGRREEGRRVSFVDASISIPPGRNLLGAWDASRTSVQVVLLNDHAKIRNSRGVVADVGDI